MQKKAPEQPKKPKRKEEGEKKRERKPILKEREVAG